MNLRRGLVAEGFNSRKDIESALRLSFRRRW